MTLASLVTSSRKGILNGILVPIAFLRIRHPTVIFTAKMMSFRNLSTFGIDMVLITIPRLSFPSKSKINNIF